MDIKMIKTTALYPEYLSAEKAERAFKLAADGGIDAVRFGEFAWSTIMPSDGEFDWTSIDRGFALAQKYGLKIILGTPTAAPPLWLIKKHPDILPVNEDGGRGRYGGRQHRCYNSPSMRRATEEIVTAMAERYGSHRSLLAWQIDNEIGAEHKYCYCDACTDKFRKYLEHKYGTVESLNEKWMNAFWSQDCMSFDDIEPPRMGNLYLGVRPHPSLQYEFLRFSSDSAVEFTEHQAGIIRRFSDRPITTNQDMFVLGDNIDLADLFKNLDVAGIDVYSGKSYEMGFYFDFLYSVKHRPFWLLEFAAQSDKLAEAMCEAEEKGCGAFGTFPFYPAPAGQEQERMGLTDIFMEPGRNYRIFRDWHPKAAGQDDVKRIAVYYDFNSSWAVNTENNSAWIDAGERLIKRCAYPDYVINTVYKSVYNRGYRADIRTRPEGFDINMPLILPWQIIYDAELERVLLNHIASGGTVIATNNLFLKDEYNAYMTKAPDFYEKVFGRSVYVDDIANDEITEVSYGQGKFSLLSSGAGIDIWDKAIGILQKKV